MCKGNCTFIFNCQGCKLSLLIPTITIWNKNISLQYYIVLHLGTPWKRFSSVFSQNKLYFAIHIFIVDGFTLLIIDSATCLELKSNMVMSSSKVNSGFEQIPLQWNPHIKFHLTFNFNDYMSVIPLLNFLHFKSFLSLVFKFTAPLINLNGSGFTVI